VLQVEVAYARAREPDIVALSVAPGSTLREAILRSGLLQRHPEIELEKCAIGVFGKIRALDERAADGDRIEVYRPLKMDPRDRRRLISSSG
jgi:putative ubiquitin-RnfH superfamily antitoxin RatB of RatAB toxin-antitoxin module